ncbi:MAG: [FeFe] hydrogenase H-cluster radical SAM maturase HydE [bacterium]|nr:[FeFe] hydrogenase H-cluster radical SAM maturase HydE [bacterium]
MSRSFDRLLEKVVAEPGKAHYRSVQRLLEAGPGEEARLCATADRIRAGQVGDAVHLRGIIELSNHCRAECHYCGLRASNADLVRYRMTPEEILESARLGAVLGVGTVVLQSGEDSWYDRSTLADLITRIVTELPVAVTLSLGERSYDDLQAFRQAGADRYLLKHETADPRLHRRLRPGRTLERRVRQLRWLRSLGYQVGSGCIVGLPGQTCDSLAHDVVLMRDLDVDMVGIGPLVPHPATPLGEAPPGPVGLTLRVIATTRLCLPQAHIAATTALATLHPHGRELALQAGANVVMPNLTPLRYRRRYEIYPGKVCLDELPGHCLTCLKGRIEGLGRVVGRGRGDSPKWSREVGESVG